MTELKLFGNTYKPDVLSCLSDLSNDEVFTPPLIANKMLDLLPEEIWHDPSVKILDPACKSGVFLREAAKRFIDGEKDIYPVLQDRIDHIFHDQLYGIAITELTSLLSRRSVYCSKYPNSVFSITHFDSADGNIRFKHIEHTWKDDKCVFCGVSKDQYDRGEDAESHAYEFIHIAKPEDIFLMKFDVIISNPPYQLSDGGNNASAIPIYNMFVEQAKKLNPSYITMIIPSRWYSGGRGLDKFRSEMLNDNRIRELYDYADSNDCFPGVDISGGICYFLWDKNNPGPCKVVNYDRNEMTVANRNLNQFHIFVRSNKAIGIINKIQAKKYPSLSEKVSSQRPFGLRTYARPEKKGELKLRWNGGKGPISKSSITVGTELIDKYKVIVSRVFFEHGGKQDKNGQNRVLSILEILEPKEVCTETYIIVDCFNTKEEATNLYNFLKGKFARYLILQATSSIMVAKNSFYFVPCMDFTREWTDEDLYKEFELDNDEISIIENTIKPMGDDGKEG